MTKNVSPKSVERHKIKAYDGGNKLTKRFIILSLLLLLIIAVGISLSQPSNNQSNKTINRDDAASQKNETMVTNASMQGIVDKESNETNNAASLNYIWSVTGLESGQVIMVIKQENEDLYGAAKYEPDGGQPWNADVIGSISGDDVEMVLTTIKGNDQSSFKMTGVFDAANQSLKGSFFRVSKGKISARGNFEAMSINPDTSSYIPATIEEPKVAASASSDAANATAPKATDQAYQQPSRFHDVRQDADRILTGVGDISQIPIGMGGSGLP
jgi:hypothetical protein